MKKVLIALALPAFLLSCQGSDEFTINGTIAGVDGNEVYLEKVDDSLGPKVIDTAKIANGKFEFKAQTTEPGLFGVSIAKVNGKAFFIGEPGDIEIKLHKDSIGMGGKISGTFNNERMAEFNALNANFLKKTSDYQKSNKEKMEQAFKAKDSATMNALRKEFAALSEQMDEDTYAFIKKYPKSYVGLLLLRNKVVGPKANVAKVEELFAGFDPEIKNSTAGKKLVKVIKEAKKVNVGRQAPDFSAKTPDGKTVSLKESLGKFTIIDFWASWCPPCRKANPELVALYKAFHSKGVNIISISLDKPGQADKWKEAIAKDGLTWTQVSNLEEWNDPIAKLYDVKSLPASFVVNEQGVVVAKDMKISELHQRFDAMFNPKPQPVMPNPQQPQAQSTAPAAKK